ncbi:MAG: U32 family peptidase, partial [Candidatus Cloacimonetes bacterium]|nr:U32 family peptidase [Candidatus Cloacimonadota bacterium]
PELKGISRESKIELEIFAHGALCYSFSGMCLFSSFLGGKSANRGQCKQPCRRIYDSSENSDYFFSLKDFQLIEILPEIMKLKIRSLKIEGRMKSAEYVYNTARAYRLAIDNPNVIREAKEILQYDFGREKTSYFIGKNISKAITENPFTGIFIGEICTSSGEEFSFKTLHQLRIGNRIRILPRSGMDSKSIKIKKIKQEQGTRKKGQVLVGEKVTLESENNFQKGDKVFLVGLSERKFKNKFSLEGKRLKSYFPDQKKRNILNKIGSAKIPKSEKLFIRIDSLDWLRKIIFDKIDFLIMNFSEQEWQEFNLTSPFIKKNISKIIVELPKFIAENKQDFFRQMCSGFYRYGIKNFMLSHISQKNIIPHSPKIRIYTNENVYTLNDAAIQFLKEEYVTGYVYPLENDFPNLISGKDRKGIVPLFFYPELFFSRMPVSFHHEGTKTQILEDRISHRKDAKTQREENDKMHSFTDRNFEYRKIVKDGMTITVPEKPVSLLHYKDKIYQKGFRYFLLDFSHSKVSKNIFNRILKKYRTSTAEQPSLNFNFKMGLS